MQKMHKLLLLTLALVVGTQLVGVAMMFVTGRLSPAKLDLVARVMRGEVTGEPAAAPTSQPTAVPTAKAEPGGERAAPEVRLRELERRESELEYQRQQLQLQLEDYQKKVAALNTQKSAWEAARKQRRERLEAAGRAKQLKLLVSMKPRSAKEMLNGMSADEAAGLLASIDERKASRILREFKSPEEVRRAQEILALVGKGAGVAPDPDKKGD